MSKVPHTLYDEDAEKVAAWRKGDLSSFEMLVGKYQKRMLNIAFSISGNYEDACEVVQDAFVAAYREVDSFRGAGRFSRGLTSITVNLSRNRLQSIRPKQNNIEAPPPDEPSTEEGYTLSRTQPSPDSPALGYQESRTLHDRLRECISGLAIDCREAVVLRDVQEFSFDEICTILEVREGTVKSRLFQGREKIKDCLKQATAGVL